MTATPAERTAESTWTGLRRRKVVHWGLIYVAAAWGFLQGLEYVTETFHWPEQLRQISFLALLIGLPIVLVLAYYHGERGQQRISTPEFMILTLLLLPGGGYNLTARQWEAWMGGAYRPSYKVAPSRLRTD